MFNPKGLMSSKRLDWKTPRLLYVALDNRFDFDFDPCPANPTFDGLTVEWGKRNFMNPPYETQIKKWIKKGYEEAQKGKIVVMLIPSRTDTTYWHDYVMKADEIWFIKGRLKFDGAKGSAPFPSAIISYYGKKKNKNAPKIKSVVFSQTLIEDKTYDTIR